MAFMEYMFTSNAFFFFFSITSFEMMIEDDQALNADFFQMPQEIHKVSSRFFTLGQYPLHCKGSCFYLQSNQLEMRRFRVLDKFLFGKSHV